MNSGMESTPAMANVIVLIRLQFGFGYEIRCTNALKFVADDTLPTP